MAKKTLKILAIETSCDETAIALVEAKGGFKRPKFKIFKNLIASQIKIHRPFGGIVPNLAKREHLKNLPILYRKIFENPKSEIRNSKQIQNSKSKILNSIDLIAVTIGPGLEPALWTGVTFAKQMYAELRRLQRGLTRKNKIKIIGVNHLEGHLYSFFLNSKNYKLKAKSLFPAIALIISGGHTILVKMDSLIKYKKLGETRDDAVGEAFDKVARLLNLPYPGGPEIEKLAKKGNSDAIQFPRPMINQKNYDFSFSGLKTAVLYFLKNQSKAKNLFCSQHVGSDSYKLPKRARGKPELTEGNSGRIPEASEDNLSIAETAGEKRFLADVAASFQKAAFDVLISKTLAAAKEFKVKSIIISGGVASNNSLRNYLKSKIIPHPLEKGGGQKSKINLLIPPGKFCTDNAAMIAVAGYLNFLKKKKRRLAAQGNLNVQKF